MLAGIDVIIEAVLYGRTDAEFHSRVELLKSLGKEVGRTMPEGVFTFRVVPFEKFHVGILSDRAAKIPFLTVDFRCKHIGCKPGADALGYLKGRDPLLIFPYIPVGESYLYHIKDVIVFIPIRAGSAYALSPTSAQS